jgi:hypothetical protein
VSQRYRRPRRLPPEIYRRRQIAALVILGLIVVVVIAVAWALVAWLGGSGSPEAQAESSDAAAATEAQVERPTMIPDPEGDPLDESYEGPFTPANGTQGGAEQAAQGPCQDSDIDVAVTMDRRNFKVNDQPRFVIVITNTGQRSCVRDLSPALQQLTVRKAEGGERLWTNTDCSPATGRDAWTLAPGQRAAFAIIWTGTSSEPGCAGQREPVPPGHYEVVAKLGPIESAPQLFAINP